MLADFERYFLCLSLDVKESYATSIFRPLSVHDMSSSDMLGGKREYAIGHKYRGMANGGRDIDGKRGFCPV